jgi:hypothetical protein
MSGNYLPTIMIELDNKGRVKENSTVYFDEYEERRVTQDNVIRLITEKKTRQKNEKDLTIMRVNLYQKKKDVEVIHCNLLVIDEFFNVDRFEPRGYNVDDEKQSVLIQQLYNKTKLDEYLKRTISHLYSPSKITYDKPLDPGITSGSLLYKDAAECSKLVKSYTEQRLSDHKLGRTRSFTQTTWLHDQLIANINENDEGGESSRATVKPKITLSIKPKES